MKSTVWIISIVVMLIVQACQAPQDAESVILAQIKDNYGFTNYDTIYILPNSNKCIHCVRRFYQQLSEKVNSSNNFFWVCPHPSEIDLTAFWKKKNVHLAYKEDICNFLDEEIQLLILENGQIQSKYYGDITSTGDLTWEHNN